MSNLSQLPDDILVVISKRLKKFEDFVSFRCVSKSLYSAAKDEFFEGLPLRQQLPYLLLSAKDDDDNEDDVREFHSLVEGESIVASLKLPAFKAKKCFESLGWLLAVKGDGNMSLLDPFSGTEIHLPHQNTFPGYEECRTEEDHMFVQKMVLSARPDETWDFMVMVICGCYGDLAFWRMGDTSWNRIQIRATRFCDFVFCIGKLYAIGVSGIVSVDLIHAQEEDISVRGRYIQIVAPHVGLPRPRPDIQPLKLYILNDAVDGSFLLITRTSPALSEEVSSYITTKFQVYKVESIYKTKKPVEEIYSLGSMAIFVGDHNSTIALDASNFPGEAIKANHIYFPDDNWGGCYYPPSPSSTKGIGLNIGGVYNMETGTIEPLIHGCSKFSTSLWINPPSL